ncbi:MAG: hypothetical protein P4L38_13415 [Syntrophaceae bacterium]|nr:hypothetical protein [Syntrophaceae bacterium]
MDEEPLIIAAMMAEEEKRRLEKKAAKEKQLSLPDTYQQFQDEQAVWGQSRFIIEP